MTGSPMDPVSVVDLRGGAALAPAARVAADEEAVASVREIVRRVRRDGDRALLELTREFDGADLSKSGLVVSRREMREGAAPVPPELAAAIESMIERLRDLHRRQLPREWRVEEDGVRRGEIVRPLAGVGCYVPGGRASYPSTVAMTLVPAVVAGVEEIVVCTPPRADGSIPSAVLYAADRAGATRVVKVGGAQAIAALAYGTESVPAVDKIVGPGNLYVTLAKREVAGDVGIDGLAGPSELVVVADADADPEFLAADMLAQAEHDPLAAVTVVALDAELPARVGPVLAAAFEEADRKDVLAAALQHATFVVVSDERQAAEVVNRIAPEHLQVVLPEPERFLGLVRNAGAIFLGAWTPVPFGDYGVGSNHVLPTMGTARFSSGIRAADFVTVTSVVEMDPAAAARLAEEVATVARGEGLTSHARAVQARHARHARARARDRAGEPMR